MNQIKRNELPDTCFSTLPGTGELVILKCGETGYYPSEWETGDKGRNQEIADQHNRSRGITPAQSLAMSVGSIFGFNVPGANPQMYYDEAVLTTVHTVSGLIKDPVISMFTPIEGSLYKYKVAGKEAFYLDLSAMPEPMMSRFSHSIILPDLVCGQPLVPVSVKWTGENKCTMTLDSGCCVHEREINADYQIIAKVGVGPVEYALAEIAESQHPFYATWERTPANDGDGKPRYYWGHYHERRDKAIEDFCVRALEKYKMLAEQRKPSIRTQLAAVKSVSHNKDRPNQSKDREAR